MNTTEGTTMTMYTAMVNLGRALMVSGYAAAYDERNVNSIDRGTYDHWSRRVNSFAARCIAVRYGYAA